MKITIIEDYEQDVIDRYGALDKSKHEVYLVLDSGTVNSYVLGEKIREFHENRIKEEMVNEGGFDKSKIFFDDGTFKDIPQADIYFCDGLKRRFFGIADRLGKEKVYLYSGDHDINEEAKRKGYSVLEGFAADVIDQNESSL